MNWSWIVIIELITLNRIEAELGNNSFRGSNSVIMVVTTFNAQTDVGKIDPHSFSY